MTAHQLLLTEQEAADRLRLSARTLRKARADGLLRYILIGRSVRYTIADLESYIDALRQVPAPCPANSPSRSTRTAQRRQSGGAVVPFHRRQRGAPGSERL